MKKEIYKLIDENKALIYSIASRYSSYNNMDDLFQAGCTGLINAYKNFKSEYNTKFSTYAYTYILGEITNHLRNDRLIKVNSENNKIYKLYEKAKEYLTNKYNSVPSISKIAEFMEMSEFDLYSAISNHYIIESFEKEVAEDLTVQDVVGFDERDVIDENIDLKEAINKLNEEEKNIIKYRYFNDLTQSETAALLGLSQVQVSRSENKILSRMKSEMIR